MYPNEISWAVDLAMSSIVVVCSRQLRERARESILGTR